MKGVGGDLAVAPIFNYLTPTGSRVRYRRLSAPLLPGGPKSNQGRSAGGPPLPGEDAGAPAGGPSGVRGEEKGRVEKHRERRRGPWALTSKQDLVILAVYVALVLAFTVVSLLVSPLSSQVGSARPLGTIPLHEVELGGLGLALGAVALGVYGRGGAGAAVLFPSLVVLLDLDHLPAFIGLSQPIRPAHSVLFLILDVAMTAIVLRRVDAGLLVMSAFTGHLSVDTGTLPPLSPISFQYFQFDSIRLPLAVLSVVLALAAGALMRRRGGG